MKGHSEGVGTQPDPERGLTKQWLLTTETDWDDLPSQYVFAMPHTPKLPGNLQTKKTEVSEGSLRMYPDPNIPRIRKSLYKHI